MVTANMLRQIAPNGKAALIDALAPSMSALLPQFDISTPLRIAHFLAQAAQETDGFKTLEEYGGPSYFKRYDGRADLGNTEPGDGARYHGRGVFQLTGRANYRSVGRSLGVDLEGNPDRAAEPALSVRIACDYWLARGINPLADADDLEGVTRKINGGLNGLADRRTYLERAKKAIEAFSQRPADTVVPTPAFPAPPEKPWPTQTVTASGEYHRPAGAEPVQTVIVGHGGGGGGGPMVDGSPIDPPIPWYVALIRAILSIFRRK